MALYLNVFKTLRMNISRPNKSSGLLLMSLDIKVHSESPTRTGKDLSITSSFYGKMVLKRMNQPLEMIIKDDPVTLDSYALKHDLLGCPEWKKLKAIATKLHLK
jgi:hypothetical protein